MRKFKYINKKIFYTFIIILVYLLGSDIPLSNIKSNPNDITLFSLGVGPIIIGQLFTRVVNFISRKNHSNSDLKKHMSMLIISSLITIILSYLLMINYTISEKIITMVILLTGVFLVSWMLDINKEYGVGGQAIIIFVSLIKGILTRFSYIDIKKTLEYRNVWIGVVLFFFILLLCVYFTILVSESYVSRSLFSAITFEKFKIKFPLNPTNAMSFMYIDVLIMYISDLKYFIPHPWLHYVNKMFNNATFHYVFLIILLIVINFLFAFFLQDPKKRIDSLKEESIYFNDEYIDSGVDKIIYKYLILTTLFSTPYIVLVYFSGDLFYVITGQQSLIFNYIKYIVLVTYMILPVVYEYRILISLKK